MVGVRAIRLGRPSCTSKRASVVAVICLTTATAMTTNAQNVPNAAVGEPQTAAAPSTQPQTNAPTESSSDTGELQSVVVTARYTKENVQSTPLAVTALTGEDLASRDLTNVTTLGDAVPNLYTHPGDAQEGTTPTIVIRGVTAGDYNFTFEPSVGIYVDDVYHNTLFGSALDLMDLDRVEVLRGPQGTLFGNASIGGAIRLFSKTPQGDDTGYLQAGYGSFNQVDLKGAFDVSLVPDKLFLRIAGVTNKQDGYVNQLDFTCEMKQLGTPALSGTFPLAEPSSYQNGCKIGTFGGTDLNATRALLRYVATDKLEFNFEAAYSDEVDEAGPEVLVNASPPCCDDFVSLYNNSVYTKYGISYSNVFLPPPGQPYSSYASLDSPLRTLSYPNQQGQNETDLNGKMDYDITDKVHLKAIVAYSEYGGNQVADADLSPLAFAYADATFKVYQGTSELRFTGKLFDDKLEWVAGGFDLRASESLGGAQTYVLVGWSVQDRVVVDNKSGYFHGIYHLTNRLSFSAGARFSADEKSYSFDHPGELVIPTPFTAKVNLVDWQAGANYQFTDDLMAYATIATGSRPPGVFARPITIYQLTPIPSEKLISYETGLKSEFLDHRLRLNLAGYYEDYKSYLSYLSDYECLGQKPPPTPVLLPSDCPAGGSVEWGLYTATRARDEGVELEASAEPLPRLVLNLDGGYNDFQSGVTQVGQPGYIAPGNLIQPHWNISGGAQYSVNSQIGVFTPRVDWIYQSLQTFNPNPAVGPPAPLYIIPARSIFNAKITYEPNNSKWSFIFSATNLFDKYYYYDLFTGTGFNTTANVAPPREFEFSVRRDFL